MTSTARPDPASRVQGPKLRPGPSRTRAAGRPAAPGSAANWLWPVPMPQGLVVRARAIWARAISDSVFSRSEAPRVGRRSPEHRLAIRTDVAGHDDERLRGYRVGGPTQADGDGRQDGAKTKQAPPTHIRRTNGWKTTTTTHRRKPSADSCRCKVGRRPSSSSRSTGCHPRSPCLEAEVVRAGRKVTTRPP